MNTISAWGRAIGRVVCCGCGALDDVNEPVYESLGSVGRLRGDHQAHDAASAMMQVEWVDEIRMLLAPVADVSERMRRLELSLHPLLVYRPDEENLYVDMLNALRPAPAAPIKPPAPSVWLAWLQERADYGEPW